MNPFWSRTGLVLSTAFVAIFFSGRAPISSPARPSPSVSRPSTPSTPPAPSASRPAVPAIVPPPIVRSPTDHGSKGFETCYGDDQFCKRDKR